MNRQPLTLGEVFITILALLIPFSPIWVYLILTDPTLPVRDWLHSLLNWFL